MPDTNMTTPVKPPSSMARAVQKVVYRIKNVSDAWFGPMQPLAPQAQQAKGRLWDFPVAFNLNYQPRATSFLSFKDLQHMADNCGVLRSVIETRKDQVESLSWAIHAKKVDGKSAKLTPDMTARIKAITKLFEEPSKDADWPQFVRQILEQHFVYDAPSIERVRNRAGILCALKVLDGATISVMLDANGGTPSAPSVAYQQVLKGMPAVDFTADELLYYPRNRRPGFAYGYPHVAQIYQHINLSIKRITEQLAAYDGANAPHGVMEGGPTMTVDQITAMQQYWDSIFNGNQQNRAKTWWVPAGSKYTALSREILFDEFDEWLARVICYCFSISPTPFIKQNNRATAEASADTAHSEGTQPTIRYLKRMFDKIIKHDCMSPDLEFVWNEDSETDPAKQAEINSKYSSAGILTIDEVREDLGKDPFGGSCGTPMVMTATGYVPVDPQERTDMATEATLAGTPTTPPPAFGAHPGLPAPGGKVGPDGKALPAPGGKGPQKALPAPAGGKGAKPAPGAAGPAAAPMGPPPAPPKDPIKEMVQSKFKARMGAVKKPGPAKPGDVVKKSLTTEALYVVSRPVINETELVDWVRSLGLQPMQKMEVRFTALDDPGVGTPVVLAENYTARFAKEADGFRLYFDCAPLVERAQQANALDEERAPSILLSQTPLDEMVMNPDTVLPFTGMLMLGTEEIAKQWDVAAFDADHTPTTAQAHAGNYRMGHISFQGLDITIENPAGSARRGKDWQVLMPVHYGYIKRTIGADGEHIDCFVGSNPDAQMVYVIDQANPVGGFDEHKVMLGFDTWTEAKLAYEHSYSDGKHDVRISNVMMMSMDAFRHWLHACDTTKPCALAKDVTMATGLYGYDQGPILTPLQVNEDEEDVSNSAVGIGPQQVKKVDRWARY